MGLATEILRFFHMDFSGRSKAQTVRTIEDFSKLKPEWQETLDLGSVFRNCSHLEQHGYLFEATSRHPHPILGRSYVSPSFDYRRAEYGEYDFIGHGFGLIVEKLGPAVRPVVVSKADGEEDIGTCFLLGNQQTIVTARHVVEGMARIVIPDPEGNPIRIRQITVSENPNLDVAVILAESILSNLPCFRCSESNILDEVLCLGFPPIPGFEATLIADLATINSEIRASRGRVVALSDSYLDRQSYILINARVKGGNSGGPIVNRQGYVVAILVQASMSSEDLHSLDSLGYGVATPKGEWIGLFRESETGICSGVDLPFENFPDGGFRTKL